MTMDINSMLYRLCSVDGVSGDERSASEIALSMLECYTDDCSIDDFGNVIGHIKSTGNRRKLLLDAHIDRVGLIVSFIDDNGFIKVGAVGGPDRRVLAAQSVTIHGKEKVKGVVSVLPPHVKSGDGVPKIEEIVIDTGYTKQELESRIELGDRITFDCEPVAMLGTRYCAGALDDRCGVASILAALEMLKSKELAFDLDVSFTTQEETGESGAKIAVYDLDPDYILEMDVSFAKTPDSDRAKCADMSKGVMIGISPSLSRELSGRLISLAKSENIPYQLEVMGGKTGTNADTMSVNKSGAKACTLSIPLKFMHTPAEIIDTDDVISTAKLITAFATKGGAENG